ncbi:MAG: GNAT family N-acetyltransferase [Desulfobacteraceae bacterium]|nr:GNAT family N-acetyltransferase [Desulfobacteraceae bacterium]
MTKIQISQINTQEQWRQLEPAWNPLVQNESSPSFFLTYEWLRAWAESFLSASQKLCILAFHENENLIGLAPFVITRKKKGPFRFREISFIGAPQAGSDYLNVIIKKGREKSVAEALYHYLQNKGASQWDVLSLTDIPAESLFLLHFINSIENQGRYYQIRLSAYCPVVKIPTDYDTYFAGLSKSWKKKFKQDVRVLHRDYKAAHKTYEGKDAKERLPAFFDFYNKKSAWPGGGSQKMLYKYADRFNDNIPVQIDFLEADGRTVAALLHLKYKTCLSMYLMAVDKDFNPRLSLGNLLVGMCIKNAAHAGYTCYDFLKGDESYKFHWANHGCRTLKLAFWENHPLPKTLALTRMLENVGKILLR